MKASYNILYFEVFVVGLVVDQVIVLRILCQFVYSVLKDHVGYHCHQ